MRWCNLGREIWMQYGHDMLHYCITVSEAEFWTKCRHDVFSIAITTLLYLHAWDLHTLVGKYIPSDDANCSHTSASTMKRSRSGRHNKGLQLIDATCGITPSRIMLQSNHLWIRHSRNACLAQVHTYAGTVSCTFAKRMIRPNKTQMSHLLKTCSDCEQMTPYDSEQRQWWDSIQKSRPIKGETSPSDVTQTSHLGKRQKFCWHTK